MPIESLSDIVRRNTSAFGYSIAWPRYTHTPRIVGDVAGTALDTLALMSSRQYFIPFVVPRPVTLTGMGISVTTAAAGSASIGIYGNAVVAGNDVPGNLLASVTGLNTDTAGNKIGAVSFVLLPGVLYWASMIASAAVFVRALLPASQQTSLGRDLNAAGAVSHLFTFGTDATLPNPAPDLLVPAFGSRTPAIYLFE